MFGFSRKRKQENRRAGDAIRSADATQSLVDWSGLLTWFARIVGLLWLMKGLAAWATIFGLLGKNLDFLSTSVEYQSLMIYFAVIDVVAAVGMWMVSSWGGVVWLIAVLSFIAVSFFFPELAATGRPVAAVIGGLTVLYCVLSWMAERSENS